MKKVFNFGKIAYYGSRKINLVTVEVGLKNDDNGRPVFTASANVWNNLHTGIVAGGQCLDDLAPYFKGNKLYNTILGLWERNPLNDLNPGTPEQMACIEAHRNEINEADGWYIKELNLLKKYGLDIVEYNGKPYKYGTAWIYREIPTEDLEAIKNLLN